MTLPGGFQPVKSSTRTLEVLEALAASPQRRSLVDLARALDIPKSSLHGILRTMAQRGWVESDPTGTRFGLGVRALQVGAAYLTSDDTVGLLGGVLDDLSRQFGETVHLGRLDGAHIVYLAKRESVHPLRLYSAIGRQLPAHATALGKALLAERPDDALDGLLTWPLPALTPHTVTDPDALRASWPPSGSTATRWTARRTPKASSASRRPYPGGAGHRRDQPVGAGGPAGRRRRGPDRGRAPPGRRPGPGGARPALPA